MVAAWTSARNAIQIINPLTLLSIAKEGKDHVFQQNILTGSIDSTHRWVKSINRSQVSFRHKLSIKPSHRHPQINRKKLQTNYKNKKRSIEMKRAPIYALTLLLHHVTATLERCSYVRCLMIDFSKAFDRVDHPTLLSKLNKLDLPPHAINWIISYLSGRSQILKCEGQLSISQRRNKYQYCSGIWNRTHAICRHGKWFKYYVQREYSSQVCWVY